MQRKKFKSVKLFLILVIFMNLFLACGNKTTDNKIDNTETPTESTTLSEMKQNEEKSTYEEREFYFIVRDTNDADTTLVDGTTLQKVGDVINQTIALTDSVDIYTAKKSKVGYTKENIECFYECLANDWSFIVFDEGGFYVLTEELRLAMEDESTVFKTAEEIIEVEDNGTSPKAEEEPTFTVTEMNKTMYAKQSVNLRSGPSTDYGKVGSLTTNTAVAVTGQANNGWYRINFNDGVAFVSNNYLSDTKVEITSPDDGGNTNDENNSKEEYTPPTDDYTGNDFFIEPEEPEVIYTVDEVISIVRTTLESNGMMWFPNVYPNCEDPSGGMSWGIDKVPMDDPYTFANGMVQGFQYQGFNLYYIEYQYIENNHVVLKTYYDMLPE